MWQAHRAPSAFIYLPANVDETVAELSPRTIRGLSFGSSCQCLRIKAFFLFLQNKLAQDIRRLFRARSHFSCEHSTYQIYSLFFLFSFGSTKLKHYYSLLLMPQARSAVECLMAYLKFGMKDQRHPFCANACVCVCRWCFKLQSASRRWQCNVIYLLPSTKWFIWKENA